MAWVELHARKGSHDSRCSAARSRMNVLPRERQSGPLTRSDDSERRRIATLFTKRRQCTKVCIERWYGLSGATHEPDDEGTAAGTCRASRSAVLSECGAAGRDYDARRHFLATELYGRVE